MPYTVSRASRPVLLALALTITLPTVMLAARPSRSGPVDITQTARGQEIAGQASERIAAKYGISMAPDDFSVWQVGDGHVAGPRGASLGVREVLDADGYVGYTYSATEAPAGAQAGQQIQGTALAAQLAGSWSVVGSYCWTDDHTDVPGWMDVCYTKYKLTSDGDPGSDYYALNMFSTFAAPGFGSEIGDPWIEATPASGSPTHNWADWEPADDTTRACSTTYGITVSVRGVPLTVQVTQCQTWDITKYATAGKFRNKWTEGICMMRQGETSLEFEIVSRVSQSAVPTWAFNWHESTTPAACSW